MYITFSCLHDIILVLLNSLLLGPQITSFILTILYSFFTQVKLWSPALLNANTHVDGVLLAGRKTVIKVNMTNK